MNTEEEIERVSKINHRADGLMKDREWVCHAVDFEVFPNIAIEGDEVVQLITDAIQLYNEPPADGSAPLRLRIYQSARPFWDKMRQYALTQAEKEVLS